VRGQPDRPGFVVSWQQRSVRAALFVQGIDPLFPGPNECRGGRFWHSLLFRFFCVTQQRALDDYIPGCREKQVLPNSEGVHEEKNVHRVSPLGNEKKLFLCFHFPRDAQRGRSVKANGHKTRPSWLSRWQEAAEPFLTPRPRTVFMALSMTLS